MPELVLELNGRAWTLDPSRSYALGRDPEGDLVVEDARVSWRHATIACDGGRWVIEDHGSTNGTYVQGLQVQRTELVPGVPVHLGNASDGPRLDVPRAAAPVTAAVAQQTGAAGAPVGQAPAQAAPAWPQQEVLAPQGVPQQGGVPPYGHAPGQPATGMGPDRSPTMLHQLSLGRVMRIGRALENDLVVSDLQVSRHHAEFTDTPDGRFEIRDLGSHNGTYVNGRPLAKSGTVSIGPDDIVAVGHSTFRLVGDRLEEFVDTGEVSFSASRLTVTVDGGKQILRDVSFGVPEKSLVGVIGPSGSGKSTLIKALTGYRPADEGEVRYDQRNLYENFAELRRRIGLVPQEDILHKELTVKRALKYAAKLRFPGDTAEAERAARIDEVLRELKLDLHKDKKVSSLSGGQRKRVSVALELLTKPSLIFLDEPTSGLDPGMDRDVMQLLRALADDGRTVLVVTHSVAELALCDTILVMAPGGAVAYFGPPDEALGFFGYESWADVFSAFENYRDYDWAGRWRGSAHYQRYAADADALAGRGETAAPAPQQVRTKKAQSWGSQLTTLMRRYMAVIASDKGFLALMVVLPVVLGVVTTLVPTKFGLGPVPFGHFNTNAGTITLIMVVGMCFTGSANSVRELIKERVIYERERATGLSRSAYLMSKVIVLTAITALQGSIISAITFYPRKLPPAGLIFSPAVEMCLVMIVLGFTTMMCGLAMSALVRTPEKTMPLLVMFAIVQIVFTGVLFKVFSSPGIEEVAWLMPARWAVAGIGTTLDLSRAMGPLDSSDPTATDPLWQHSAGVWTLDVLVLVAMGVLCGFLVLRLLRRHEPEVMRK